MFQVGKKTKGEWSKMLGVTESTLWWLNPAAAVAIATSPPRMNGLRPHRVERYRIFTVKAFSKKALVKTMLLEFRYKSVR